MSPRAAIVIFAAALAGSRAASADPPPASPIYLLALPERQWAFAELLWQGHTPCKVDLCEAGYHAGKLVLSVMQGFDYVQAVAGVQGCQTVSYRVVRPDEFRNLKTGQRVELVRSLAKSIAALAVKRCSYQSVETIDTTPLARLVMPPQSLAK